MDHGSRKDVHKASQHENGGDPRCVRVAENPQQKNHQGRRGEVLHLVRRLGVAEVRELQGDHDEDQELENQGDRTRDQDVVIRVQYLGGKGGKGDPRRVDGDGEADEASLAPEGVLQTELGKPQGPREDDGRWQDGSPEGAGPVEQQGVHQHRRGGSEGRKVYEGVEFGAEVGGTLEPPGEVAVQSVQDEGEHDVLGGAGQEGRHAEPHGFQGGKDAGEAEEERRKGHQGRDDTAPVGQGPELLEVVLRHDYRFSLFTIRAMTVWPAVTCSPIWARISMSPLGKYISSREPNFIMPNLWPLLTDTVLSGRSQ
ncbi:hypothetical protein SDC9_83514 [bioreactor metagenome]|uniref:Uncharacterized protein n=1 Tax=bioreactor metagenome TaxID=1076179 RepID=A0A644Z7R7_9ZZZZ